MTMGHTLHPDYPEFRQREGLTDAARRLLIGLGQPGAVLCHEVAPALVSGARFWINPGGQRCSPSAARQLIESGFVRPRGDGLLPGVSQTFELVPP